MSWEANIWAIKQRMKLPQEQLVLIVLGNCADPDAVAFSKWPGRDHWWKYLSKITRLSRSSLFRHINTIVALGLAERSMLVLADGSKRPTIALNLEASFDIETEEGRYIDATQGHSRAESHHETHDDDGAESDENNSDSNALQDENAPANSESHHETEATLSPTSGTHNSTASPTHGTDPVPPVGLHIDSSKSCSKDSPLPPSGGLRVPDDLFDQFVKAWGEPIQMMRIARAAWDRIATDDRPRLIAASSGLWAYRRSGNVRKEPPSAQSFIRDQIGWDQWLSYVPQEKGGISAAPTIPEYPVGSDEGRAIAALYRSGGGMLREHGGKVRYGAPLTAQLMAFTHADPGALWVEDAAQVRAWRDFFGLHVFGNRREIITTQGIGEKQRRGIWAPWPWPPSTEGKIYTPEATPPPTQLGELSDQDAADFR